MTGDDALLTTAEVAAVLGVSAAHVRRLVGEGALPATKRGRDLFVRRADMEGVRDRGRPGPRRQEREAMTVYHTPTLPLHWIIREPAGTMHLVPAIAGGWVQRRPYRGHVRGLSTVAPQTARLTLVTLDVPTS